MADAPRLSLSEATELLTRAFMGAGVGPRTAQSVAEALVAAEAEGQVGHGFSRLGDYAAQVRSGKINTAAAITLTHRGPASLLVDADCGFAYPALDTALEAGLPLAYEMGIAVMAVANSHHCGALSVQVEKVAEAGLIGLMVANTPKAIAPWGGTEALFGTNPIAFAAPQAEGPPLVIDLSLSVVARGKVMNARKTGAAIPDDWALDALGQPTTDATAALAGTMRPIGDAKGTALALMVELLAAAFTGSAFSRDASSFFAADGPAPRVGQTLIAIDPGSESDFAQRTGAMLELIDAMPGARIPGTRRLTARADAVINGIAVPEQYLNLARDLARGS